MKYGYCRVSTHKKDKDTGEFVQTVDLQKEALERDGVSPENIYQDRISGSISDRPGLNELLGKLSSGDVLVVWKLDRLGRSVRDLLEIAEKLKVRGVTIKSLQDGIDSSGAFGGFLLAILGAVAEFERETIRERVRAGIASSRRAGGRIGRLPKLNGHAKQNIIDNFCEGMTVSKLSKIHGVSRGTIYNVIHHS